MTDAVEDKDKRSNPENDNRGCWVGPPHIDQLDVACHLINRAFDETCYLVGSATRTRNFRDVDIRLMLPANKASLLFGPIRPLDHYPLFKLLNLTITLYLRQQTGLPIDFQIQEREQANKQYRGEEKHERHPLGGLSKLSRDQQPAWITCDWPADDDDNEED